MIKLRGENKIKKFKRIAEELAHKISGITGVAGILFTGGLVRGFVDQFSDLDIIIFLRKKDEQLRKKIYDISLSSEKKSGIDIDLEVHFLEEFKNRELSDVDKWDFSRINIFFDPDGVIKDILKEKLRIPRSLWINSIVIPAVLMSWYCCPPKQGVGTIAESWIVRGNLVAAHYCLNHAVNLLFKIVFTLNRDFLPPPKWIIPYSHCLKWLPEDFNELIKEAIIIKTFSEKDFKRRLKIIREIWMKMLPKIEEKLGFSSDLISEYYVEKILRLKTSSPN